MRGFVRFVWMMAVSGVVWGPVAADYDPMEIAAWLPTIVDMDVKDAKRDRGLPIRVYLAESLEPAPVILLSHGLGGSRATSGFLGKHWSSRGYITIAIQHPGSDESVWKGKRPGQVMSAMRQAANAENLMLRLDDVHAVLNQLEKWQDEDGHALEGRLDLAKVGMAGHSFGAVTTQGVSGQWNPLIRKATDGRIKAALVLSPSLPRGGNTTIAFSKVKIPWLLMTGTNDTSPIGDVDAEDRRKVYPLLPPGDKYELVLDGAPHSVFTDRDRTLDRTPRNPKHHPVILAISTAFWDAYLQQMEPAKTWLKSDRVREILDSDDTWQMK